MATIGDVVLIYFKDEPTFFARIESIEPDTKKDWLIVQLLILAIPLRNVTWILREEYINGAPFTMEGNPVRIEAVNPLPSKSDSEDIKKKASQKERAQQGGKVIPFAKPKKDDTKVTE
ncbi:MAG: hypothetical protein JRJ77_06935 [Deltaproteobacteria bacterium]|nr:hypothetical protein [Deltaproteobacteria bacterium]MBW2339215.1 hypothetical protein [Deltaproteobacteria bacterium]